MRLSYRDLQKREVVNVEDGRCLGRIIDLDLRFPEGLLTGIVVPGRRIRWFRLFDKTEIYIDHTRIIKIGGDVILVNVNCGDACSPNVGASLPSKKGKSGCKSSPNCPPSSPPCPPVCQPERHSQPRNYSQPCPSHFSPCPPNHQPTCEELFGDDDGYDEY